MEISAIDTMWVLFGTMFIFFMHSGFALLETGFSRVKNSSTAWIDNLLDFAIASLVSGHSAMVLCLVTVIHLLVSLTL